MYALHARFGFVGAAVLLTLAAGCASVPPSSGEAPAMLPPTTEAEPAPDVARGGFAVPAVTRLDIWNALGQILVRLDGVTYEGRSQMLGLYDVGYRGERFLIVTRARVMQTPTDGMVTDVGAVQPDGRANDSVAAVELLHLLQQRLPAELARIAAGEGD